jgi:hypothetical protein
MSYGPYSSLTNDFNVINVKTINYPQDTQSPPFDDVRFQCYVGYSEGLVRLG